jgi:sugar (pentulose or hexulose) kinase
MPHILALDPSTSATKAVLFDARGRLVDKASRRKPLPTKSATFWT